MIVMTVSDGEKGLLTGKRTSSALWIRFVRASRQMKSVRLAPLFPQQHNVIQSVAAPAGFATDAALQYVVL